MLAAAEDEFAQHELAVEYVEFRATTLFWALRRPADALALVERAQRWRDDPGWSRGLEPLRVYLVFLDDGPQTSLAETERLLADPLIQGRHRRRVEMVHAANLFFTGRAREADAIARTIRPDVPLRDVQEEVTLDVCSLVGLDGGEDLRELDAWLQRTLDRGVRVNDHTAAALAALHLAEVRRFAGRPTDASRWAGECIAHLERRDTFGFLALAWSVAAAAAGALGDAAAAERGDRPARMPRARTARSTRPSGCGSRAASPARCSRRATRRPPSGC